jgi:uncharacterized membrane protein
LHISELGVSGGLEDTMAFCTGCGKEIPAGAAACPSCGQGAAAPVSASAPAGGLTDNVAGALAYFTFIPAIIFLVMEPYSKNKFLRFHSFQCLFLCGACFVVGFVVGLIPVINIIAVPLLIVGELVIWLVLVLKAYQGQKFKLPFLGDIAEQQANAG